MKMPGSAAYPIAYRWLSYLLVAGFIYYWLLTTGLILLNKTIRTHSPRQVAAYNTFWRQNWRLFAFTKTYNRQLNLVIRDTNNPARADTFDIVQYSLSEKRKYAPFNNYQDAMDQMLYIIMNSMEIQVLQQRDSINKAGTPLADSTMMLLASQKVSADTGRSVNIKNLEAYARQLIMHQHIDTAGKEYQLQLLHRYIPPQAAPAGVTPGGRDQLVFITPFKPFGK